MTSLCEKTGHLIRITKTDRGSGDQYAHCQICGCAVVKGSWNTPWKQPKFKQMPLTGDKIGQLAEQVGLLGPRSRVGNAHEATEKFARTIERAHGIGVEE